MSSSARPSRTSATVAVRAPWSQSDPTRMTTSEIRLQNASTVSAESLLTSTAIAEKRLSTTKTAAAVRKNCLKKRR